MDAVKFLEERNRMCNSFSPDCEGCRVDEAKPVMSECCQWVFENPERVVKIVEEWAATHQRKTRQSIFLELYPETVLDGNGVITICPVALSKSHRSNSGGCKNPDNRCDDCRREFWMQEVE